MLCSLFLIVSLDVRGVPFWLVLLFAVLFCVGVSSALSQALLKPLGVCIQAVVMCGSTLLAYS